MIQLARTCHWWLVASGARFSKVQSSSLSARLRATAKPGTCAMFVSYHLLHDIFTHSENMLSLMGLNMSLDLTLSYTILSLDSMTASHDSSIPDFGGLRQAPCVKSVTYIWENTWGLILPMRNESIRGAELTGKTCLSSVIGVRKMASKSHRNGALT